jgi:predicted amidohydrolase
LPFYSTAPQTDLFVVVANWPASRSHHWRSLLVARAIENQAFVIGVNRTGEGGGLRYQGDSLVISPYGEILLDCGSQEGAFPISLDKSQVAAFRGTLSCLTDAKRPEALELRRVYCTYPVAGSQECRRP